MDWTKRPTFSAEMYQEAQRAWEGYGPEWNDWRNLAHKAGILFPPSGSPMDSWSDRSPSQRALIIRAIRETPRLLKYALTKGGASSWGEVVDLIIRGRDGMGERADEAEEEWNAQKRREPEAMASIREIVSTIGDSVGSPE